MRLSLYWRSMPNLPITAPWVVLREIRRIQFLLADFTGVADDVRGKSVLRVEAALRVDQLHFGKEIAVRFDEGQVGGRELLFDDDGVVFGPGSIAPLTRAARSS
jgi:hypothetical protein